MSPVELIRLIKLKKAAELIQEGKHLIGDICYMVGISSPSYFSKLFFKQFGISRRTLRSSAGRSRATAEHHKKRTDQDCYGNGMCAGTGAESRRRGPCHDREDDKDKMF